MTVCQLQKKISWALPLLLVCLFFIACAEVPSNKKNQKLEGIPIVGKWNDLPLRFTHKEANDQLVINPFFDVEPMISNFKINYFLTNKEKSRYNYKIDLYSGKLIRAREYCAQKDIWNSYDGELLRPNFSQGIVPKIYNELKRPMRIIIFSSDTKNIDFKNNPTSFYRANILGSVIIEQCLNYPCDQKERWRAEQILIGVNEADELFFKLLNFTELKEKIDWNYSRAMLVNMFGSHKIGIKNAPAYRIAQEFDKEKSLAYLKKKSFIGNTEYFNQLSERRKKCFNFYDSIWDESEKLRRLEKGQAGAFLEYFKKSLFENKTQFTQCSELFRPANIEENPRRFWFFTHLQGFFLLERNEFYYNCRTGSWNRRNEKGDIQKKELEKCTGKNFENAFDQLINGMTLMKNEKKYHFRFIEYDSRPGGSHQKIYAWVKQTDFDHACFEEKSIKKSELEIFPQDVVWESFKQDREDDLIK